MKCVRHSAVPTHGERYMVLGALRRGPILNCPKSQNTTLEPCFHPSQTSNYSIKLRDINQNETRHKSEPPVQGKRLSSATPNDNDQYTVDNKGSFERKQRL
ncbi:hypothetical protein J6590_071535 [Homalodisca vitripennis]|nr:hypothetical protein J6590_071535 [Homalodisca vitripennis]